MLRASQCSTCCRRPTFPILRGDAGAAGCIKGYDYQSQVSDQYPRREDLVRMDYNMTSKMRVFGHFINNNNTYDSQYGSFVLGSNMPLSPIQYANPGYQLGSGQHLHFWPHSPTNSTSGPATTAS